ncbi:MFS transporter [Bosea sp. (in: a-proteobacteria)]|uniref:MFS transporter n=1 Tax=Bosea sp. (in: a-proteobacteria) TaxID=1871050 RepID=UPI00262F8F84|nr:MFS transporter [Bosea sp. (in: a-proteobacteria)]MCO5090646.1 MFS transporter [Bosea sp. (in: a-proteobacteria)]
MASPAFSPAFLRPGGPSLIVALGVTQTFGYGTLYYPFTVLAPHITETFGWAPEWTFGGLAAGLLLGGAVAPLTGSLIDRYGTRLVMTVGSGAAGLSLLALAEARGIVSYILAMVALQAVTTAVFYDAAFAALTQARGQQARRAISQITLIGGFASTLFWPLTSALLAILDWRGIYRLYGLAQLLVCLPLHLVFLPGRVKRPVVPPVAAAAAAAVPAPEPAYLTGKRRSRAFLLLALAFSLQGFAISAVTMHMLALLQGFGLAATAAVAVGAIIGPGQVVGRLGEMLFGRSVEPVTTAWFCAWLMPFGFALLLVGGDLPIVAGLFAVAFGVSMGLTSIVRGTVPLQLFGPTGFGAMLGKLAAPGLVTRAAAPFIFVVSLERGGVVVSTLLLIAVSALAAVALMLLARLRRV